MLTNKTSSITPIPHDIQLKGIISHLPMMLGYTNVCSVASLIFFHYWRILKNYIKKWVLSVDYECTIFLAKSKMFSEYNILVITTSIVT